MPIYETSKHCQCSNLVFTLKKVRKYWLKVLNPWKVASNDNFYLVVIWLDVHLGF